MKEIISIEHQIKEQREEIMTIQENKVKIRLQHIYSKSSMNKYFSLIAIDEASVRVTNLPDETTEQDLKDPIVPFDPVNRMFLAKDKTNNASKGFAFITFHNKKDETKEKRCEYLQ